MPRVGSVSLVGAAAVLFACTASATMTVKYHGYSKANCPEADKTEFFEFASGTCMNAGALYRIYSCTDQTITIAHFTDAACTTADTTIGSVDKTLGTCSAKHDGSEKYECATNVEPEPDVFFSTSVVSEPEPSTAGTEPEHTIAMTITLTNISAVADEATLLQQIRDGLLAAAGGGTAEVTEVVIAFINVVSVYKNLPEIVVDAIITAYAAMTSFARASVKVNGQSHSGDSSTRRLQSDATVKAKVTKQSGVDVVQASQTLTQAVSLSAMITQLEATSDYAAGSLSGMTMDPITTELSVTSKVKGTATAPTEADIVSNVGSSIIGAGATVSGVSVASTGVATTTQSMEDNAPVASLLIAWAVVCYAFVMA